VAAPDLLPGGVGGPGPLGWPRRSGPWGSGFHTWGAEDHPAVVRIRGSCFWTLRPCGHVEAPNLLIRGGDLETVPPVVRPGPYALSSRSLVRGYG
jgi:hypothetical protein